MRPDFWSIADDLKSEQFQLLSDIEFQKVLEYVAEIEPMEVSCHHTLIDLTPAPTDKCHFNNPNLFQNLS
jgi:hypothetical protein